MLHNNKNPHFFNQSLLNEILSNCLWLFTFRYLDSNNVA